jgi:hypothetical protein
MKRGLKDIARIQANFRMKRSRLQSRTPLKRTPFRRKLSEKASGERLAPRRSVRRTKPLRKVYPGGREVLTGSAWIERKIEVWLLDSSRCTKCHLKVGIPIQGLDNAGECHHVFGRGMSGGFRSDSVWADQDGGVRNLVTLCQSCHQEARMKSRRPSKNAEL